MRDMSAPSSESEGPDNKLELRTKVWFGVGTIGEAATNWIFQRFNVYLLSADLRSGSRFGSVSCFYSDFADAITDPLIGSISDRFRSRFGRRHPFMFAAPIPLAASIFLIFNPPEAILGTQDYLFAWLLIFTICMRTFVTFFAVPHLAMGAELSTDYIERTNVMSFNNLFGYYGGQLMHIVTWFIVFGWLFKEEGGAWWRSVVRPGLCADSWILLPVGSRYDL